ncbi:unnamed protein product [Diamesa hyperborea]
MNPPAVQFYFHKKFSFKNKSFTLPTKDVFFSTGIQKHQSLQVIKTILNHVKSKLNDNPIEEWSQHTRKRNPCQQIVYAIKNEIKAEFVTQAFAKMFECIASYPLVDSNFFKDKFVSVHLCEAPGAFIAALNHYLKLNHPDVEFSWRATTLNPYYEGNSIGNTILDDRFIYHTLKNWFFGEDYDGNILKDINIRSLIEYCKNLGSPVNLVTCDGSIDCLDQPENQEEHTSKLHIAEFIVCLAILADNGSLILKMFTFYEPSSVSMLYVLNCCFEEVHVFKPATSKEGNSEVYVIGIRFKKDSLSDVIIEKIIKEFQDNNKSMLPLSALPDDFLQQTVECAKYFMNLQVAVIENNIRNFRRFDKQEHDRIKYLKSLIADEYVRIYNLKPIDSDQKILHGQTLNNDINLNIRVHSGSHTERKLFEHLSREDQITVFYDRLKSFYDSIQEQPFSNPSCDSWTMEGSSRMVPTDFISIIHGKVIERVVSSKFLLVPLFKYFINLIDFLKEIPDNNEVYNGKQFIKNGNHLSVAMEFFRRTPSYNFYEKNVTSEIFDFIMNKDYDEYYIEDLPLLTHFLVGVVCYLGLFVFKEIQLKHNFILLKTFQSNGKENLFHLMKVLDTTPKHDMTIVALCDTKMLISSLDNLYRPLIDFNNYLCLKFCSFYLNLNNS